MITSPANLFLSARDRPKGAMRTMPNLLEAEDIDTIGASVATDLTWKQIFDTDACTICGRCTSVCPANITGKPLDPREIVLKSGEVAASLAGVAAPVSNTTVLEGAGSLFDRIRPEEVFACTTCKACDEICPVDIEILDKILDMRRYLTLMESEFPTELGKAFVAMENQSNPWGMSQQARADWTEELDFEVPACSARTARIRRVPVVRGLRRIVRRPQHRHLGRPRPAAQRAGIDYAILGTTSCATAIGASIGQRIRLPAAGPAEHRDVSRSSG
jgi:Fe-S oxidoreductase